MSHVLYLALTPSRRAVVEADLDGLVANGHAVTLVTLKPEDWPDLDPRVVVIGLQEDEQRHPVLRAERGIVFRAPPLVLRATRKLAHLAQKAPPLEGPATRAREGIGRLLKQQPVRSRRVHADWFLPQYSKVRPYLLWRVAQRKLDEQVEMASVAEVVVAEPLAVPIGWRLARRHPELAVSFELDRDRYAAHPGPAAAS